MPLDNERINYYRVDKLLWRWKLHDGTDGCKIVPDIALSMDMTPPPLPRQPTPKTVPTKPAPKPPKPDALDKMVDEIERVSNAISRFKTWLNTPDPPKAPKPPPIEKKKETVPPFDLQEIPGAMRKLWMPVSAKLMERWFAGALNYSPTDDDEAAYINQDGMPYPSEMYDTTTVKLDWVLKYKRAKAQYDALQKTEYLLTPKSLKSIGEALFSLRAPYREIDALDLCNGDLKELHKRFQFQRTGVESSLSQKIGTFIAQRAHNSGIPDDLTGALGSFNFYAAIGYVNFNQNGSHAAITSIIIYIKDNYTFTTEAAQPSQYLGHWNRNGVVIVPASMAAVVAGIPWVDYPVAVGDTRIPGNVYYPIRNSSFREWQQHHNRGGDFVIFSDHRHITLREPIQLRFT
ncbi:DUF6402 family protein [Burkholderia ubonensis]|uniref:DUF6402 family protein n=1 Tax=Burkholderia ubonensis TaxID=101571 RepID=UPI000A9D9B56|nr:DUF6402 family protein [Burkholderia ubonensis]